MFFQSGGIILLNNMGLFVIVLMYKVDNIYGYYLVDGGWLRW